MPPLKLDDSPLRPLAPLIMSNAPLLKLSEPLAPYKLFFLTVAVFYLRSFEYGSAKGSPYSSFLSASESLLKDVSTLKSFLLSFFLFSSELPLANLSFYRLATLWFLELLRSYFSSSSLLSSGSSKLILSNFWLLYSTGAISPKSLF